MRKLGLSTLAMMLLFAGYAMGDTLNVMVGDHDGYGLGCADNSPPGACIWPGPGDSGTLYDGRDAAELAATNGAQITDVYSAIFPEYGPNPLTAHVLMPFSGTLLAGTLTVGMGDFQSSAFGPILVDYNGVAQSWYYDDGFQATVLRTFTLDAAVIAAANAAHQLDIRLEHTPTYGDYVAFDFFQLQGQSTVPEPGTLLLLGLGLVGFGTLTRKRVR